MKKVIIRYTKKMVVGYLIHIKKTIQKKKILHSLVRKYEILTHTTDRRLMYKFL